MALELFMFITLDRYRRRSFDCCFLYALTHCCACNPPEFLSLSLSTQLKSHKKTHISTFSAKKKNNLKLHSKVTNCEWYWTDINVFLFPEFRATQTTTWIWHPYIIRFHNMAVARSQNIVYSNKKNKYIAFLSEGSFYILLFFLNWVYGAYGFRIIGRTQDISIQEPYDAERAARPAAKLIS